ncbi:DUF1697 domain-containing protein [Cucumibacter marinus]|uniref:DUF1697 domain-containing protein n=1 Tax=Cucumibacter marinus TaxID=1121252 RepID=UPI00041D15EF|nr:DUF1697 domain-containing protein [Cucumibacter marinus]
MTAYIALFHALNVGGRKAPMAELRQMLDRLGYTGVKTYIQSGNAVFASDDDAANVTAAIEAGFEKSFGYVSKVMLRDRGEIETAIAQSPYAGRTDDHKQLHVGFCAEPPAKEAIAAVNEIESGGDEITAIGTTLYMFAPEGLGRSKMADKMNQKRFGLPLMTMRNWRTTLILRDMLQEI